MQTWSRLCAFTFTFCWTFVVGLLWWPVLEKTWKALKKKKNPPVNKTNLQKSQSRLEEKRLKIVRTQRDQSLNVSAWWLLEEIHTVEMTSSDLVPLRLRSWRCAGRVESSPRRDKLRVCVCRSNCTGQEL